MGKVRWERVQKDGQDHVMEIHQMVALRFQITLDWDYGRDSANKDKPIWLNDIFVKWRDSDAGQFIIKNSVTGISIYEQHDVMLYKNSYVVCAELEAKKLAEFYLKWG